MGEFYIDMGRYGWFPAQLPSEEGLGDDDDGDDDDDDDDDNRQ